MTEEQYKVMEQYCQQLEDMRKVYNDQQLLDWCQVVMDACVTAVAKGPFDTPPTNPPPEDETGWTIGQKMAALALAITPTPPPA